MHKLSILKVRHEADSFRTGYLVLRICFRMKLSFAIGADIKAGVLMKFISHSALFANLLPS